MMLGAYLRAPPLSSRVVEKGGIVSNRTIPAAVVGPNLEECENDEREGD